MNYKIHYYKNKKEELHNFKILFKQKLQQNLINLKNN